MADFASAPNSCELNKLLNRNWAVQVKPVGAGPEEYRFVLGLTSVGVQVETTTVDSSDLNSDGWALEEKVGRALTINLEGQFARKGDLPLLSEDQRLLKYTGEELGSNGKVDFRAWRTDIDDGWEGTATNNFTTGAGGANELSTFTSALKSSCAPTRIHSVKKGQEKAASEVVPYDDVLKVLAPAGAAASSPDEAEAEGVGG